MNAIIALCHFCESHGPTSIFTTQSYRETGDLNLEQNNFSKLCSACNAFGNKTNGFLSKDEESNISFLSTQNPIFNDVFLLVKQASVRSLSCEVSNRDGGIVFFGDAARGHVLSHTFHIKDIQGRGFYQLFSIVIIMKDKYYLLNIQPFLAENLKKISEKLQSYANKVYDEEVLKVSPRDHRLSNGSQIIPLNPRSLVDLTNEENIFAILHSHFSWILLAGSQCLSENFGFENLEIVEIAKPQNKSITSNELSFNDYENGSLEFYDDINHSNFHSLRYLKEMLKDNFIGCCYCTIAGVKIIIRGPPDKTQIVITCLKKLIPEEMHNLIQLNCTKELLSNPCYRIITVMPDIEVPIMNNLVFRIDIAGNEYVVKWLDDMPNKFPDILVKILKAIDDSLITDFVLEKRLKVLTEEWKNKIICLSKIRSTLNQNKLKTVLEIQNQDQVVINYWQKHLNLSLGKKL